MLAFEVYVNRKRVCVAGIGEVGVLNTMVDHVVGNGRNEVFLSLGGLIGSTGEHVLWTRQGLKTGDEVWLKVIKTEAVDRPKERHRRDPKKELTAQKRYVREMARTLGWQITTRPVRTRNG